MPDTPEVKKTTNPDPERFPEYYARKFLFEGEAIPQEALAKLTEFEGALMRRILTGLVGEPKFQSAFAKGKDASPDDPNWGIIDRHAKMGQIAYESTDIAQEDLPISEAPSAEFPMQVRQSSGGPGANTTQRQYSGNL